MGDGFFETLMRGVLDRIKDLSNPPDNASECEYAHRLGEIHGILSGVSLCSEIFRDEMNKNGKKS